LPNTKVQQIIMSEPTKIEEPTLNKEDDKNSKSEESKDVADGRKSPSSDPLLESALPKEEKTDEPKISILRSKRNKIMLGIALTVLLIIGITIVVWFLTAEEPDFDTFDGKSPPSKVKKGGALDVGDHRNFSGCDGKLKIRPKLKRPDIEVDHTTETGKKFLILANKRKNKKKTEYVETIGNCCWQISNKEGVKEDFGPGESRETKEVKYIKIIKTIDCPTY